MRQVELEYMIEDARTRFNEILLGYARQHVNSTILSHVHYHTLQSYLHLANLALQEGQGYAQPGKSLIYLTSVSEYALILAHLYQIAELEEYGHYIRNQIRNFVNLDLYNYKSYLQVAIPTAMTSEQHRARSSSTARQFSTGSMVFSGVVDPIIITYASDEEQRGFISGYNQELLIEDNHTRHSHRIFRFRLNTEHGQSINVFRAEITLTHFRAENCLYVIALHQNSSCAAVELPFRMTEMDRFLQAANRQGLTVDRVVLLLPDMPGSVASGGYGNSLEEISLNGVQRVVHHLLEQGVDPAYIVVRGNSIGSLFATHAVHALKTKEEIEVSLLAVDSLAQTRQFISQYLPERWPSSLPRPNDFEKLGDTLANVLGNLALTHFDAPAHQLFEEIDPLRRFCVNKKNDSIIPPKISLMFNLPGNSIEGDNFRVNRRDCYFIRETHADHNDDVAEINYNPCVSALIQFYNNAHLFQQKHFYQLIDKLVDGIEVFKASCENNQQRNRIGENMMAAFPQFIDNQCRSEQPFPIRIQAMLGWILHHHTLAHTEYNNQHGVPGQNRFVGAAQRPAFLDFCQSSLNYANSNGTIRYFISTQEGKDHCVAQYQAVQPVEISQVVIQ